MLRALKFTAKLQLSLTDNIVHALHDQRRELALAARPRFLQEILRMLQGGAATKSFELLEEYGILTLIFPELISSWQINHTLRHQTFALLTALDRSRDKEKWSEPELISILVWPLYSALIPEVPMKLHGLKVLALRLLAPFTFRIGFSMKGLTDLSVILALNIMQTRENETSLRHPAGTSALQLLELRAEVESIDGARMQRARAAARQSSSSKVNRRNRKDKRSS